MVIGSGLVAKKFTNYEHNNDVVIFASGVSDSNENREIAFEREYDLLSEIISSNQDKIIVYFSSCDVIYADKLNKPYYFHKAKLESRIKETAHRYYIFRLPQVIGVSSNRKSLINHFIDSIVNEKLITVWAGAYKNLITIDDAYKIADYAINNSKLCNSTINVINRKYYKVEEIIHAIEDVFDKKAILEIRNKGGKPNYQSNDIAHKLGIEFDDDYLKKSIFDNYVRGRAINAEYSDK